METKINPKATGYKTATERDKLFEEMRSLQCDKEKLEQIYEIIQDGFSTDYLNETTERLNEKFFLRRIKEVDTRIIEIYKKLKLIK